MSELNPFIYMQSPPGIQQEKPIATASNVALGLDIPVF